MREKNLIQVSDQIHINHTSIAIYKVLSNLDCYHKLWPNQVKIQRLNQTTLKVSPRGLGFFTWEIRSSLLNKQIILAYDGIFSGYGTWNIRSDATLSYVSYSVKLNIQNSFLRFINKIIPIHKMHSKMMKKVFKNLDQYINNKNLA